MIINGHLAHLGSSEKCLLRCVYFACIPHLSQHLIIEDQWGSCLQLEIM